MESLNVDHSQASISESETERQARIAWEVAAIAEARDDVDAGRLVDAADVRAWIDSLRTDNPLPAPYSRR